MKENFANLVKSRKLRTLNLAKCFRYTVLDFSVFVPKSRSDCVGIWICTPSHQTHPEIYALTIVPSQLTLPPPHMPSHHTHPHIFTLTLSTSLTSLQCDEVVSLDRYFDHWSTTVQPSPFFFAGGCSVASGPPGDVSRNYNTIQVRLEEWREGRGGEGRGGEGRGGEGMRGMWQK